MEWRILGRLTLHLDHGENFVRYDLRQMRRLNFRDDILPFRHNRVMLRTSEVNNSTAKNVGFSMASLTSGADNKSQDNLCGGFGDVKRIRSIGPLGLQPLKTQSFVGVGGTPIDEKKEDESPQTGELEPK